MRGSSGEGEGPEEDEPSLSPDSIDLLEDACRCHTVTTFLASWLLAHMLRHLQFAMVRLQVGRGDVRCPYSSKPPTFVGGDHVDLGPSLAVSRWI